jgi:superfamily I DNA/RNA helicase
LRLFGEVTAYYAGRERKAFTHIVVDEAQDLGVPELRLLAAIAASGPDALFFAGDLGQRIFQQPFSWAGLGIDVRGRSQRLKVNYRTSHQIRRAADRLLPKVVRDVDGLEEERFGTVSVFNGPDQVVAIEANAEAEIARVGQWISEAVAEEIKPSEIGLFCSYPIGRAARFVALATKSSNCRNVATILSIKSQSERCISPKDLNSRPWQ